MQGMRIALVLSVRTKAHGVLLMGVSGSEPFARADSYLLYCILIPVTGGPCTPPPVQALLSGIGCAAFPWSRVG